MEQTITLKLLPAEADDETVIKKKIAQASGKKISSVTGFYPLKKSIDARSKRVFIHLTVKAFIDEPFQQRELLDFSFKEVHQAGKKVIVVGSGPAGLFAALQLIEKGIQPVILERGKEVRARRRDLAVLNKEGIINPESNYCFGEGGAGTYSDGKLYTRSSKRGDVSRILNLLVYFGAEENIIFESHPHIGTNKLPHIITAIRQHIINCGGRFLFEKKVADFTGDDSCIKGVITADAEKFEADAVILATGHSARDIFQLLYHKKILIESKPFAIGVRIEHPQSIIDGIQYHCHLTPAFSKGEGGRDAHLPPASYSLVQQVNGRGVFSFCMCPGGIIAPASTNANELVVNGWSPSKRNNPFANSGIVVSVEEKDLKAYQQYGPLAAMYFQQEIEQKAFVAGGGKFAAPAQRMIDFTANKISATLPECSYLPGILSASLKDVIPGFVYNSLKEAFVAFGKKMKGYYTNDAVVVATESRTSSPVRIPRNSHSLQHPQIKNLYPCGEGAGYAGGIVSAAMDGEKTALAVAQSLGVY
ncbi:MAG: FAD-binding protein [Chitinophagaceae bacterium]|nr:FAD-binding protein [Chitinophagaceae bacterium]